MWWTATSFWPLETGADEGTTAAEDDVVDIEEAAVPKVLMPRATVAGDEAEGLADWDVEIGAGRADEAELVRAFDLLRVSWRTARFPSSPAMAAAAAGAAASRSIPETGWTERPPCGRLERMTC